MTETSLVQVEQLGLTLPHGDVLFTDLSFSLGREKVGLVGPNGAGKTTFLRLLMGEATPTTGVIRRHGRWGYLPQNPAYGAGDTVAHGLGVRRTLDALARIEAGSCDPDDFAALGEDWLVAERTRDVLEQLGLGHLTLDRPIHSLSGGELTRVVLGRLLLAGPDLLVLDEPTNNLDKPSRQTLYRAMETWPGAALIVTHDRELLRRVERIVRLSSGSLKSYGGNYDAYAEQVAAEEEAALRRLEHAERELKKTRRKVQESREKHQQRQAQGQRYRKTGSQSKLFLNAQKERAGRTQGSLGIQSERMLETASETAAQSRAAVELRERITVNLEATRVPNGKVVLHVEGLRFVHPGESTPLFDGLDFTLVGPERVAVQGPNGTGKTTLLRLVMGDIRPDAGRMVLGVERCVYLDQRTAVLDRDHSVLDNFRRHNPDLTESESRLRLAQFLFVKDTVFKPARVLSGGERMRAALACTLMAGDPPQLVLLDEPTNHLDIEAVESMEQALMSYEGALLIVSHDDDFLRNVAVTRRLDLG